MDNYVNSIALDDKKEADIIEFRKGLSNTDAATVRFFDRGDYYTVHDDNAHFVACEYYHTKSVIKHIPESSSRFPYICVSRLVFEATIRDLLLRRSYRVEVYVKSDGSWSLSRKGSPGNLQQFEDVLFTLSNSMSAAATVMSVRLGSGTGSGLFTVGVAYADATLRQLGVCEFEDNDQLGNVEAMMVQVGAKECLIVQDESNPLSAKLGALIERSNILLTTQRKGYFSSKDIVQDLGRILKRNSDNTGEASISALPQLEMKLAMSATAALVKYLDLLSDETNFGQYVLRPYDLTRYQKLDSAAVLALNLLPSSNETTAKKSTSLFGLLNKCKTAAGQRLLMQWVQQPLLDLEEISRRHNIVEDLVGDLEVRVTLENEHLRRLPDLFRISKRLQSGKASLQDVVRLYQVVLRLPLLLDEVRNINGDYTTLIEETFGAPLAALIEDISQYKALVEASVDLKRVDNNEFLVNPSYDSSLESLRSELDECVTEIEGMLQSMDHKLNLEGRLKLECTNSSQGYLFRVTRKDEKVIRTRKDINIIDTKTNGVRFTTSALSTANDTYRGLHSDYESQQQVLVAEIMKVAMGYCGPVDALNALISELDVLVSFATVTCSAPIPFVRPSLTAMGDGDLVLEGARHPCLEVQDDVAFIANDCIMRRADSHFAIITGPNMGGKSTYIRQVGVIILMAQIGCFVPCARAAIPICDSILARVGAGDAQIKGVSTFMAEMIETTTILKSATANSLIIIDELGRGTSTYDGFGLAWAISEHIATKLHSFCLFATHFHELTSLADVVPTVVNRHVTALTTNNQLTLLYKVRAGACDQSFGIHVAELAKFPRKVIDLAKRKAVELEDFSGAGTGSIESGVDSDDVTKKRRLDKQQGEALIRNFLIECSKLDVATATTSLQALKQKLRDSGNSFVISMMDQQATNV